MAPDLSGWTCKRPFPFQQKIADEMSRSIDWGELRDIVHKKAGCDSLLTEEWSMGRHAYVRGIILHSGGHWICKFLQAQPSEPSEPSRSNDCSELSKSKDDLKKEEMIIRMLR